MRSFSVYFVAFLLANVIGFELPQFPKTYHAKGVVKLPYAELAEPFEFWTVDNSSLTASRLDWYGSLDVVLDRPGDGPYGTQYKLSYTTLGANHSVTSSCFAVNGAKGMEVTVDTVLPDLGEFEYAGRTRFEGREVDMLLYVSSTDGRKNTYKFYYDNSNFTPVPVAYSFLGYDTLMGSHYDRYDVIYHSFDNLIHSNVFDYPKEQFTCGDFPGPGAARKEHEIWMNPMRDLFGESRFEEAHKEYSHKYDKQYRDETHRRTAASNYMQNLRFIHMKNRQALSFKLAVNHMADLSQSERKQMLGLRRSADQQMLGGHVKGPGDFVKQEPMPDYWDWRIHGAVTQVKDQAICGSCWSFGTTGTLEGAYFVKHGKLIKLSEQNLVDCAWSDGNMGCDGGWDYFSYKYIMSSYGGLMLDADYGSYKGQNGKCHFNKTQGVISIDSFSKVTGEDPTTMKEALIEHGPISVAIDASVPTFSFYSSGIYDDPDCRNGDNDLDHAVLLVGFGELDGQEYWLVKNSWSTYWGNLGYVTFKVDGNTCGVMTQPTYTVLN